MLINSLPAFLDNEGVGPAGEGDWQEALFTALCSHLSDLPAGWGGDKAQHMMFKGSHNLFNRPEDLPALNCRRYRCNTNSKINPSVAGLEY